ncbi:MAG TPA: gluconate 2-dehydrogenase subunit 3 family protein [Bryobacteraceae bacterium]|nr:gluconate 2-dehydrogenase subunit 3 family protein [Bryobacteraceae bacterium]
MNFTRRDWIFGTLGSTAWAAIAAAQEHARESIEQPHSAKFEFLDIAAAADVGAIAERILPSDDGPGATEAGVIFFIDRALKTFDADKQDIYRNGLTDLNERRAKMFPDSESFAGLSKGQQDELLRAVEDSDFFETIRVHTLLGFLGNPSYGGNRGSAGWKYIGFEDRMVWTPPFGYYDAEAK